MLKSKDFAYPITGNEQECSELFGAAPLLLIIVM